MYGQNVENQIGGADAFSGRRGRAGVENVAPPTLQLVTDGRGNVYPLGIYTDNSAIRTTQGFQPIREKFKLLHFARKLLPKERTAHCFYNRITKEEGVSVFF